MNTHIRAYIHTYLYTYTIHTYILAYLRTCVGTYIHACIQTLTYTDIHTYIHRSLHGRIFKRWHPSPIPGQGIAKSRQCCTSKHLPDNILCNVCNFWSLYSNTSTNHSAPSIRVSRNAWKDDLHCSLVDKRLPRECAMELSSWAAACALHATVFMCRSSAIESSAYSINSESLELSLYQENLTRSLDC